LTLIADEVLTAVSASAPPPRRRGRIADTGDVRAELDPERKRHGAAHRSDDLGGRARL
jgi:hypothetical protein